MHGLPDPPAAANRVKRVLQSIFEATYDFSLEELRKMNLGPASNQLAKYDGTTKFTVAYVVQSALGGHAIPIDAGSLRALYMVKLVSEADVRAHVVPGLERAVAKSKGIEFGSLLHQLGADFVANPYTPGLRAILTEIDPDAGERLPRRRTKRQAEAANLRRRKRVAAAKRAKKARQAGHEEQPAGQRKKPSKGKKAAAEKPAEAEPKSAAAKKKPAATKKKPAVKKKSPAAAKSSSQTGKKRSASSGISKRKPR